MTFRYNNSNKWKICENLIKDFEATNPLKKYKSDLDVFIRESRLEDFIQGKGETIFVSTIHKAKGKEFDNVFLLLENLGPLTDETWRQLYVAMTRAKQNLFIHLNGNYLNGIQAENLECIEDTKIYPPPEELIMHLSHRDIWLDFSMNKQHLISQLMSGDDLTLNGDECLNANGQPVLKFSLQFLKQMESMKERNYELKNAKVNFIVYWLKEETKQEFKIVLPEVYFGKMIYHPLQIMPTANRSM